MKALAFIFLVACGAEVETTDGAGTRQDAATAESAEVSIDISGMFELLCTDGPLVSDCVTACLNKPDRSWCGRLDAACSAASLPRETCCAWAHAKAPEA